MDNPNITMKEYIRLEEEKARRRGKVYNWETAMYGKIWDNKDVHDLGSVETEFPAIVFNDTLTSEAALSCEPTVSSLNDEIDFRISFDESDDEDCMYNDDDKIDIENSLGDLSVKPLPDVINTDIGAYAHGLNKLLETRIQLTQEELDFMADAGAYEEIERVNDKCTLKDNLQQASTSGTQTDKAPVYDSNGSAKVHHFENCYDNDIFNMFTQEEQYNELLKHIPKPHQVQQNDGYVISAVFSVEQSGETVEQHPANVEETRDLYDSLYNNLATEVEKVNLVNRKLRETNADLTTELARYKNQEKCFEISQEKYDKLERCYQKSVYQEQMLIKKINALH
ncbi:hypothetical protein Tco_0901033 [Tanacetum coccineum]